MGSVCRVCISCLIQVLPSYHSFTMASYSLATSYFGDALISGFNWFNGTDPTGGFVAYQSQQDALSKGLYSVDGLTQAVTLRVDTTNVYPADGSEGGRPSVRIESKLPVNKGLVIGDFAHMPGSVCGSWPAYWMYGADWPNNGEIDIIEGANTALKNIMAGHTKEGCTLPPTGFTGSQGNTDCTSPGNNGNIGCGYVAPSSDDFSYGDGFNAIGGGVYALEWTDEAIKIWNFPRTAIPADITNKQPDPSSWGLPQALFGGSTCDVDRFFNDMNIVINMDFCGAYAGNVWGITDTCNIDTASTCVDWVAGNPGAFSNVYWEINYIDVYDAYVEPTTTVTSSSTVLSTSTVITTSTESFPTISSGLYSNMSSTTVPLALTSGATELPSPTATATTDDGASSAASTGATGVTSDVPQPTPTDSLTRDPPIIGDFVLLGCFGSNSSFVTFESAGTDAAAMTPEVCVGLCSARKYAGVFDSTCYCADSLDAASSALPDIDQCNQPCPGNPAQYCGGIASLSTSPAAPANGTTNSTLPPSARFVHARAVASPNILLTVYANPDAGSQPAPAPGLGDPSGSTAVPVATVIATVTGPMTTITTTLSYTTVCSTNPASLVVVTTCATFTVPDCGCPTQTYPSIPVSTVVHPCNACGAGGEDSVTLTVPVAAVVTGAGAGAGAANVGPAAAAAQATVVVPGVAQPTGGAGYGNGSSVTTAAPAPIVTAAAGVLGLSKELLGMAVAGTCALYFAVLL
ncbi:hypothetical protein GE09DRAFT_1155531 [Coniochaeta sp. 2T2.1]|nr:hypothetical protein GE09DRAFT_1155531 [Coniochaeta sp. 2T2.1]